MKYELMHVLSVPLFITCLFNIFLYCYNKKDSWRLTLKYDIKCASYKNMNTTAIMQTGKKDNLKSEECSLKQNKTITTKPLI